MLKRTSVFMAAAFAFVIIVAGCEKANLKPVYNTGDVSSCKVVQETTKEVSFEQPSLNKSKVDTTQSIVEMSFDQKVASVEADGSAIFDVTITAIKLYSKGQKGVNIDYDSTREADKADQMTALIGQSYKVKIAADGKASVVDAAAITEAAKSREAKALVSAESIEKRHSITAMPDEGVAALAKNKSWTKLGTTPKGALQPKAFEKVYALDTIEQTADGKVAIVKMNAVETNKTVEGFDASTGGLGVMANIFDSTSDYTGQLDYNITTGKIKSYKETLKSEHVAAEEPKGGDASKGPDVLTMRFINSYSFEVVK